MILVDEGQEKENYPIQLPSTSVSKTATEAPCVDEKLPLRNKT